MSSNKLQKGELNKHRSCIQNWGFLLCIVDLLAGCWITPLALSFPKSVKSLSKQSTQSNIIQLSNEFPLYSWFLACKYLLSYFFFYTAVEWTVLQPMWMCTQAFMSLLNFELTRYRSGGSLRSGHHCNVAARRCDGWGCGGCRCLAGFGGLSCQDHRRGGGGVGLTGIGHMSSTAGHSWKYLWYHAEKLIKINNCALIE